MTITIIIASVLAYFLVGISTFCWGIRNFLLSSNRPKLYGDNPSYWFDCLDGGDILFCSVMSMFWPITFLIVTILNIAGWLWTHLLVKIITKSIERKLRKEKKTDN